MAFSLARSAHNATNLLHSLIYFAPEAEQPAPGGRGHSRGLGGHICALTSAGLSGIEALVCSSSVRTS
jgi:hypothetical protein